MISILLIFSGVSLWATITATYVADSNLYFTTGADINSTITGSPFAANAFAAHLGTLTFNISNNQLFDPSLVNMTATNNFSFEGPMTWYNDSSGNPVYSQQTSTGRICAVSTINGVTSYKEIWGADGEEPLTDHNGNLNVSEFVVILYLMSYQTADHYKPGGLYTLTSGTLGSFNVAVANNGGGIYNSQTYVSVNGQAVPTDGSTPPTVDMVPDTVTPLPYVDPDHPLPHVDYFLSIINNNSFSISNAFGILTTPVATAQVAVVPNSSATPPYGVNIAFSDANNSQSFSLNLEGNKNLYSIPYTLKFLSHEVVGGEQILWNGMSEGNNQQTISVTGINSGTANAAPEGDYSDTITVTITPVDTY